MLSMGELCAGSPEAKVLVARFCLAFGGEGSFGITVTAMGWRKDVRLYPGSCFLPRDTVFNSYSTEMSLVMSAQMVMVFVGSETMSDNDWRLGSAMTTWQFWWLFPFTLVC